MGFSIDDTKQLTIGMVLDMLTETGNDRYNYDQIATQEQFDRF